MQNLLDLVNSLNPMQRSAVELPAEHALILAGAGSGKTRVLTTRIAWIIAKGMARPAQILAVTFTNKAAREMRDRLEGMVNADMRSHVGGDLSRDCAQASAASLRRRGDALNLSDH